MAAYSITFKYITLNILSNLKYLYREYLKYQPLSRAARNIGWIKGLGKQQGLVPGLRLTIEMGKHSTVNGNHLIVQKNTGIYHKYVSPSMQREALFDENI